MTIETTANFGGEQKAVKISQPHGGGDYQVLINNYLQGTIVKHGDNWIGHLNARSVLTSDDIAILGEMIDNVK